MTGAVLSILIGLTVSGVAELPALSVQPRVLVKLPVEVFVVSVPPPPTVVEARPEPVSAQLKLTVTLWLVHVPATYAVVSALVAVAVMTGPVLSIWTGPKVTRSSEFPALSVQSPLLVTLVREV